MINEFWWLETRVIEYLRSCAIGMDNIRNHELRTYSIEFKNKSSIGTS